MFGFSIFKIFFTIVIIVAVWQGFKWLKRREAMVNASTRDSISRESSNVNEGTEDMLLCPDCGAYVAKSSGHNCI